MHDTEDCDTDKKAAFTKPANVSDQVQHIVDLSLNDWQVKVHFEGDRYMDRVIKFIRSFTSLSPLEDSSEIFAEPSEMEPVVLKTEVCDA